MEDRKKRVKGEPTYSYAFNELGECVNINAEYLNTDYRKLHSFHCINCGDEMYAALKDDRKCKYFAHKTGRCSYDTYLHTFAKYMIKDAFEAAETFVLSYRVDVSCTKEDCTLRVNRCVNIKQHKEVDLKKWYDNCELEKEVSGKNGDKFVADILLTSSKPNIPPLLIEIFVTHECTPEKKESGLWIAELKIGNEWDVENICSLGVIKESEGVRLYNFERKKKEKSVIDISRYVHYPSGESVMKAVPCNDPTKIIDEDSDLEINTFYNKVDEEDYRDESFIKLYIDQRYGLCKNVPEYDRLILQNCRRIKLTPIKGQLPQDNIIVLYGPHKFYNPDFIAEHITHYLERTSHLGRILFRTFGVSDFSASVLGSAEKLFFFADYDQEDWYKDGKSAGFYCVERLLRDANAVIIFDNGNDKLTKYAIEKAKERNIPTHIVDITQYPDICPECGWDIIPKYGKYGIFYACSHYPDCNYIRKQT